MGQREDESNSGMPNAAWRLQQHVRAFAPSAQLREVQVSTAAAVKDGARSRVWEAHAAAAARCAHGEEHRPGCCQRRPSRARQKAARSASLSSTPRPWTQHSASGL
jgi:hypothetical protein